MRNPSWNNEELILAMDLYFQLEYGQMDGRNPQVKALSELLTIMNEPNGFSRSVNSISLKLANFKRIDPEFKGKGMIGGGKLEESVWRKYQFEKQLLNTTASEIRNTILSNRMEFLLTDDECESRTEGGRNVYISQKVERDVRLRNMAIKFHGTSCMACGFNFYFIYGEWGKDFIEVHHLVPLGGNEVKERITDPTKDLIVLCANCHRMVHRRRNIALTLEELKQKIKPALLT